VHARIFLLGGFVSVENKGRCIYLPKLDVAGSIPVARSKLLNKSQEFDDRIFKRLRKVRRFRQTSPSAFGIIVVLNRCKITHLLLS
jgi:hypothetical protein